MGNKELQKQLAIIAVAIVLIVLAGVWLAINVHKSFYSFMLVIVAVVTYFGFLMLPGGFAVEKGFTESRIRLTIVSTLSMTYLIYFCIVIFWAYPGPGEKPRYDQAMLNTLTDLLKIVLPFYFGATAVSEIAQKISKDKHEDNGGRRVLKN